MSVPKKQKGETEDLVNTKIQQKFDLVFTDESNDSSEQSLAPQDENNMSEEANKKVESKVDNFTIDLDFSLDGDSNNTKTAIKYETNSLNSDEATTDQPASIEMTPEEDDGFSLDFDFADKTQNTSTSTPPLQQEEHANLDDFDVDLEDTFAEGTQKTIVGLVDLTKIPVDSALPLPVVDLASETVAMKDASAGFDLTDDFSFDQPLNQNVSEDNSRSAVSSADLMSTDEAKANIESTIKDILRPETSQTNEFDIDEMTRADHALDDLLDKTKMFSTNDFNIGSSDTNSELQDLADSASDFSLDEPDFTAQELAEAPISKKESGPQFIQVKDNYKEKGKSNDSDSQYSHDQFQANTEESIRNLSTLRSLREEREDLLAQLKNLKVQNKEVEQDSLTLKANLEEAKIEITILRKRHMVEIEDLKYRLGMSEEKKLMAEEKARQAELRREKLEQKVRIDFNQVKQREKELESKLELLSMDVDSQVQSRDQKILELRRKIDALEFNMENASIKEQKSSDDKRKLEDRLNKIMKTLRNSIKNLEDDIDHVENDHEHLKDKNS